MKSHKYLLILVLLILIMFTGCDANSDKGDITGSNPTTEERESVKEKSEVIEDAIAKCEEIRRKIELLPEVHSAMVYINHESVLVALELNETYEEVDEDLRSSIEKLVYEEYQKAKTIAVSNDKEVYQSIARLVRSFKDNSNFKLFMEDMKEIIGTITKNDQKKN